MIGRARVAGSTLAALAAIAILATPAAAQSDYPNRPIQLIVPYGPGGVADVGMRIMAEKLSVRLKQNVVIENRPGAGGIVAAKAVATAAPDGYNVLMTGNNNAIAVALFKSLPYDILKDFASTSTVSFFDLLIVVKAGSPLKNLQDVVKAAKANPGKLNIGTINPGSTQNLAAELFKNVTGIAGADRAVPHLRRHGDRAVARRPRRHVRVLHRRARAALRQEDRRARLDRAQAQRLSARGADRARGRHQGLRGAELERAVGAGRDAEAGDRHAGEGSQRRAARSVHSGAVEGARHGDAGRHAGRDGQAHEGRHRQMGRGDREGGD